MRKQIDTTGRDFNIWQIDHDINGNSRYVVHYLTIPFTDSPEGDLFAYRAHQIDHIEHARKALYGKRYRAKWFGGGIVFQAYAGNPVQHVLDAIERAKNLA